MSESRWQQIQSLFEAVVERPAAERRDYLFKVCPTDPELIAEVLKLVEADAEGHALLDAASSNLSVGGGPDDLAGHRIGPYCIVRTLGEGGMGSVFLADRDRDFQQQVALKVVKYRVPGAAMLRRFEAERQILASLDHPNIARLLDGGVTEDGQPYFTMEFVEGRPITKYCDDHRLSINERLTLFATVCRAVQHAQQNLVIHRDLKPSNILVSNSAVVKLLDFGIAKVVASAGDRQTLAQTGIRLLTPGYGAPEQVRGEAVTTATDVFSLGVILYELLTGAPAHPGATIGAVETAVLERVPQRPSLVEASGETRPFRPSQLKGDLDTICVTALRKVPAERYASASALLNDIERYLAGRPIAARPPTLSDQVDKFVRRNRRSVAASVALVTVLVSVVVSYTVRLAAERDRARIEAAKTREVATFLTALFAVSDPQSSRGRTISARELLERGARRIENELRDQPEVRAEMLATIGRSYRGLGVFELATQHLMAALTAREALYAADHRALAESHADLAGVLTDRGLYGRAEPHFRTALAMYERLAGPETVEVARVVQGLGAMLNAAGRFEPAEAALRRAVDIFRRSDRRSLGAALNDLGLVLHERNRYDESEAVYREALALLRGALGGAHPQISTTLYNLGQLMRDEARYAQAESLHRETLAMDRKLYGQEHPRVADSMTNLGMLLVQRGRLDDAEAYITGALAIRKKVLEPTHPDIGRAMTQLARLKHQQGNYPATLRLYREALEHQRTSLGPEHPLIAGRMNNLSWILHDLGSFDEALDWAQKGLALNLKTRDEGSMSVAISRMHIARAQRGLGRLEKAQATIEASLATGRRLYGESHPFVASARNSLALILIDRNQLDAAQAECRAALKALSSVVADDHPRVLAVQTTLARAKAAKGDRSEAQRLWRHVLTARRKALVHGHPLIVEAERALAVD